MARMEPTTRVGRVVARYGTTVQERGATRAHQEQRPHRPSVVYVIVAALYFAIKFGTLSLAGGAWGLYLGIVVGGAAAAAFVLLTDRWSR